MLTLTQAASSLNIAPSGQLLNSAGLPAVPCDSLWGSTGYSVNVNRQQA